MQNQNEYIDKLLERYWNCETNGRRRAGTPRFLIPGRSAGSIPTVCSSLAYVRQEQAVTLSEGFDERLKAAMDKETTETKKYITIRIFAPLLRVAASVLLIVGLGVSIFFITRENNKPGFVETYDDPNAAIKDASSALEVLSYALQKTEEASLQTLRTIDDLDIDWSALDSLSSTASGNDTLHDSTFMTTEKRRRTYEKTGLILIILLSSASLFANDFISQFIERYSEEDRPLNNVNIGKTMLDKMADNTEDEDLKNAFRKLKSIRIVSTENAKDSRYYFQKANELVHEEFSDYEEVVSVNEKNSKISVWMKKEDENNEDLILVSLDENSKLTIITVSGKIDFKSISKLSGTLKNEPILMDEKIEK